MSNQWDKFKLRANLQYTLPGRLKNVNGMKNLKSERPRKCANEGWQPNAMCDPWLDPEFKNKTKTVTGISGVFEEIWIQTAY